MGCRLPRVQGRDQPREAKTTSPRKSVALGWKSLAPTRVLTSVGLGPVLNRSAPATKGDAPQGYWPESQARPGGREGGEKGEEGNGGRGERRGGRGRAEGTRDAPEAGGGEGGPFT